MRKQILVLGATGTLGSPIVRCLAERGHTVRVLARSVEKARQMFGAMAEVVEGRVDRASIRKAVAGCDAVHISLPSEAELTAVQHVVERAAVAHLERVSYVSGTSASEENRWFEMIDVKMRAEDLLRRSGIPHTVFCPTWAMETLHKFVRGECPPRSALHHVERVDREPEGKCSGRATDQERGT